MSALLALMCVLPAAEGGETERALFIRELRQVEELSDDRAGKAFALLGRVDLESPGVFRVRAARVIVWLDPEADTQIFKLAKGLTAAKDEERGIPLWAVRSIYAEGGLMPATFQTAGRTFRCRSFFYDFTTHRGVILDAELRLRRGPDRDDAPDLVMRADKFRATGPGEWRARDVRLFSSNYHKHNVKLEVRRVVLDDRNVRTALGELIRISARDYREGKGPTPAEVRDVVGQLQAGAADVTGKTISLYGITARAFGVPLVHVRDHTIEGDELLPLRYQVDVGNKGSLGRGFRLGVGMKRKPLSWMVGAGYYHRRGPLFDIETKLETEHVTGRSFGVYLRDHGEDYDIEPPTRNRFWFQHQYRWQIDDTWRLDGEWADISDGLFLRVYDEGEFKEGKEQETLLYLRRRGSVSYVTLTGKVRTIGFATVVEEAPRFAATLPGLTLLRLGESATGEPVTVQLAGMLEIANLRWSDGDLGTRGDFRTGRYDLDPTVYVSFTAGPFRIVPFATFRLTGYENALDGDSAGRFAGSAGIRTDLQLSRWFKRVRHVMNFALEYVDLYTLTDAPSDFFTIDDTDRVTAFEMVSLRWRNRLQRRNKTGALEEFLSFEILVAWFPDRQQPLGRTGDAYIETDLEWQVLSNVHVSMRTEVDPERGRLETGAIETRWEPFSHVAITGALRHLEGDSDILTMTAEVWVDTRWRLVGFGQIDFKDGEGLDQGLVVERLGKTTVLGVHFSWDPGDDDFSVRVRLDLLEKFRKKHARRTKDIRHGTGWR